MIKSTLFSVLLFFSLILFGSFRQDFKELGTHQFVQEPQVAIDIEQIKKRGYLEAIVDNNSVSYFVYRGMQMGYQYELLNNLAKELKVELKIKVISGIEKAIDMLNRGEGDIIAFQFEPTTENRKYVSFAGNHFQTSHVLVQRKPKNWRRMSLKQIEETLIRKSSNLVGKEVHVTNGSLYKNTIEEISNTLNGKLLLQQDSVSKESESLIQKVAFGDIDYTITSECFGKVFSIYYPNLDVKTRLTTPKQVAWAFRKNSPELVNVTNRWMSKKKREGYHNIVYAKYFKSPKSSYRVYNSKYSSVSGNRISRYDEVLKREAKDLGWDWRLLASLIYQESTFRPNVQSWAGAIGLMQLMPATAERFGAEDPLNPMQNIRAGVKCLKHYDKIWNKYIKDQDERIKFVLASYNAGIGHVFDARRLARKYQQNFNKWDDVETYLKLKSNPKYYLDPIVVSGYCKCREPIDYVKKILTRYSAYSIFIEDV